MIGIVLIVSFMYVGGPIGPINGFCHPRAVASSDISPNLMSCPAFASAGAALSLLRLLSSL